MEDLIIKRLDRLESPHLSIVFIYKSKKTWKRKYNNFFMVAGGTGITPLYQVIQYITEN